ncbi:ketopantoate reductase family protein [Siccirubricoccus sp. KC 17139]|uniref:2-dehydropantoate 2-reductase n=1 Tax=Siccirubricoccus soli TaxID=2899147 RepID=A0ABT1D7G8_9PROT|nr:ketopantoate reductase family protein [Siccirubricoccus soli]MCO6417873.1 ketopantoate reductase family protein [Siccirubricoccus soli]MCP2684008.1 ketopantoate reductase family protein [Siccirubricoccus soli]
MKLLIVGAGSTGGYFGARLAAAGRDVTFLLRPGRAKQIAEQGLQVISPQHGDLHLTPRVVTAGSIDGAYDTILLTVKAYHLEQALEDIAPAVGPQTMIMPVLNGMRHVDAIAARFGAKALIGGVCKVAATLDAEGRIRQLAPFQSLTYGEMDGSDSPRLRALDAALSGAGFDAVLSPRVVVEMWEKWMLLAAMGGVTCLGGGPIGAVASTPGGIAFAHGLIDEVMAVTMAEGFPFPAFHAQLRTMFSNKASPQASSMFRDMQDGRWVEADQILGDMIARGAKHGIATPLLNAAHTRLRVYQAGIGQP